MKHLKAYSFRIYPNKTQQSQIIKTFGCCRFIYNFLLSERQTFYNTNHTLKNYKHTTEKQIKVLHPFLTEVDSIALQQSRLDLDKSYKNFFRSIKQHTNTSIKYKSKHSRQSYRTVNTNNNLQINFTNHTIKLPKIGNIKYKDKRTFASNIRSITISKNNTNKYYASILTEENINQLNPTNNQIGLDLGIISYITDNQGNKTSNPKILKTYENQLAYQQQQLAKRTEGSNNYNKQKLKVAKIYEKITNIRRDFQHKLSTKLIHENQMIVVEDLNTKQMMGNHRLAKAIGDCSWSNFVDMLEYKADWYGRKLVKINPHNTSKTCSKCGTVNQNLTMGDRIWICSCGIKHDRDTNAATNILTAGIADKALTSTESASIGSLLL